MPVAEHARGLSAGEVGVSVSGRAAPPPAMALADQCRACVAGGDKVWCLGGDFSNTETDCDADECQEGDILVRLVSECDGLELSIVISVVIGLLIAPAWVTAVFVAPEDNESRCIGFRRLGKVIVFPLPFFTFMVLSFSFGTEGLNNTPTIADSGMHKVYVILSCVALSFLALGTAQPLWKWKKLVSLYVCAVALALDITAIDISSRLASTDPLDVGPHLKVHTQFVELVLGTMIGWGLPLAICVLGVVLWILRAIFSSPGQESDRQEPPMLALRRRNVREPQAFALRAASRKEQAKNGEVLRFPSANSAESDNDSTKEEIRRLRERIASLEGRESERVEEGIPVVIPTAFNIDVKGDSKY